MAAFSRVRPPAAQKGPAMRFLSLCLGGVVWAGIALGQSAADRPLTTLPYVPGLDPASMDRTVDPCTNLYRFSCGGWIKNNPIPPDQAKWDVYAKLTQDNQRYLWGLLEEAAKPSPNRNALEQQIGDFFYACMDEPSIERAGLSPLKPGLDQIAALASIRDLAELLGHLHLRASGDHMMFGFGSGQDYSNSAQVIAFASAGGLGLPDRDY